MDVLFNIDKLKSISPTNGHEAWLDEFNPPQDNQSWINALVTELQKSKPDINTDRLKEVINKNINLAYKIYILYIQEKNHEYVRNFHATIAQGSLINFLEHIDKCFEGSNERLNSIIASFFLSANDIQTMIFSYQVSLVEEIVRDYFQETPNLSLGMEVHTRSCFFITANRVLGLNVPVDKESHLNQPTDKIANFLCDKFPKRNTIFKLIQHIESQFCIPDLSTYNQGKVDDFVTRLRLVLNMPIDIHQLTDMDEETNKCSINKKYIIQLICQKLIDLEILQSENGHIPKPNLKNINDFCYWYFNIATDAEKASASSHELDSMLHFCIKHRHLDKIEELLRSGANPNIIIKDGDTALIWAAKNGDTAIVKQLLEKDAGVNIQNQYGDTALILASKKGHTAIVEQLQEKDAGVNIQNQFGDTALIWAANNGHTAIVKQLLDRGADVNIKNQDGNTALILASKKGHTATVEQLLDRDIKDQFGDTALMWAANNGHTTIVKLLLDRGADVNINNQFGNTALILAANNGHTAIIEQLLDRGADVNIQDKKGDTALIWAAKKGRTAIVEQLLDRGADVGIQNQDGNTALMLADQYGYKNIVNILRPNATTVDIQYTELIEALKAENKDEVEKLLKASAKITSNSQKTALIWAAKNGHTAIVEQLLARGADVKFQDEKGYTALELAAKNGHQEIVMQLIIASGKKIKFLPIGAIQDKLMHLLFQAYYNNQDDEIYLQQFKTLFKALSQAKADPKLTLQALQEFHAKGYKRDYNKLFWEFFFGIAIVFRILQILADLLQGQPAFKLMWMTSTQRAVFLKIQELTLVTSHPLAHGSQP